ncbi:MAG: hypothetical protein ACM3ND_08205 [Acidobacteriota bacterium]
MTAAFAFILPSATVQFIFHRYRKTTVLTLQLQAVFPRLAL